MRARRALHEPNRGAGPRVITTIVAAVFTVGLFLTGCATGGNQADTDGRHTVAHSEGGGVGVPPIDLLIADLARSAADALADREAVSLTVSFFTTGSADPQVSPYSDYLAEGLTTELAAIDQTGLSVVSRRAVEQILGEIEFQASELVDEQTQARVGRLAGADVILTGSVVAAEAGTHVVNAQLIDVESGVVLWGARAPFAGSDHAARPASTTVTVVEQEALSIQAGDLALTIIETFDDRRVRTSPETEEVFWGPRFVGAEGSLAPVERKDGFALAYRYQVEFDEDFNYLTFTDTDGYVTLMLSLDDAPVESTGVTLDLNPGRALVVHVGIRGEDARSVPLSVAPNEWQRLSVPFGLLVDLDDRAPARAATLEVTVPYGANIIRYAFPRDATFSDEIRVDNIGFYTRQAPTLPAGSAVPVADFESGEFDASVAIDLYEAFAYVDYAATDEGIVEMTRGVSDVSLIVDHVEAVQGDGVRLSASAEVTDELAAYLDAGRAFVLSAYVMLQIPPGEQSTLQFDVQSDNLARGDLDLYLGEEFSSYAEFPVSPFWGSAEVDLPPGRTTPTVAVMSLRFPISSQTMARGFEEGRIDVAVVIDRFRAE